MNYLALLGYVIAITLTIYWTFVEFSTLMMTTKSHALWDLFKFSFSIAVTILTIAISISKINLAIRR